jgi:hypothetical protein
MIVGADENAIVTQARIDLAKQQTGHPIEFWGRYFKDSGNTSREQYQPAREAALLNQTNIRVLPIGRQTGHVAGSQAQGRTDGKTNANAIIEAFGKQVLGGLPQGLLVGRRRFFQPLAQRRLLQRLGRWPRANGAFRRRHAAAGSLWRGR